MYSKLSFYSICKISEIFLRYYLFLRESVDPGTGGVTAGFALIFDLLIDLDDPRSDGRHLIK